MNDEEISKLVDEHMLMVGDQVALPSIHEALPLLNIYKTYDIKKQIEDQFKAIRDSAKELEFGDFTVKNTASFVIPLDSFIALPDPYKATIISQTTDNPKKSFYFTCVTIASYTPRLVLGKTKVLTKISYLVCTIGSEDFDFDSISDMEDILDIYEQAVKAGNAVINAYKITPGRHSHLLQPVSPMSTPSSVDIYLSDFEKGKVVENERIFLNEHLWGDIWQSRNFNETEQENFVSIHYGLGSEPSFPMHLLIRAHEAIDARCMGDDNLAVLLADYFVELCTRYILYKIHLTKGKSEVEAMAAGRRHTKFVLIVDELARELGFAPTRFKEIIGFSIWNQSCRKKRNSITHEVKIITTKPTESFKAVDSSTQLVKSLCGIVNKKYPGAIADTQWLMASTWMTEMMKEKPESE
jgi:hypothetical protein